MRPGEWRCRLGELPWRLTRRARTRSQAPDPKCAPLRGPAAYRHKDLGIWQVWTWEEVQEEVRAYAAGLARLGLKRGDAMAIVGANRPKLYWSVMAAQMLGAVPVPVYADAGADEIAYVLAHADVTLAAVEDQEQVDKLQSIAERLPKLERIVYDERRGLRDYDHGRLQRHRRRDLGRSWRARQGAGAWPVARPRNRRRASGSDRSIILYTSGTTGPVEGRGTVRRSAVSMPPSDTVAFDQLTAARRGARLSAARLGGGPLSQLCASAGRGLLHCLSGERRHAMAGHEGDRADLLFRPPRVFEQMLTAR